VIFGTLKMWTWNNAYMIFGEKQVGSIEPGKLADMDIISKDFTSCPEDEIKDIETQQTIVGGKVVFDRAKSSQERKGSRPVSSARFN